MENMSWRVKSRIRPMRRADRTLSRTVTLRRDDDKPFKVLSAETKPRKWGDVKIVERPLGGWQVVVENIDPDAVRQFSKKPYLEVKTDLPDVEMLCVPLRVEK